MIDNEDYLPFEKSGWDIQKEQEEEFFKYLETQMNHLDENERYAVKTRDIYLWNLTQHSKEQMEKMKADEEKYKFLAELKYGNLRPQKPWWQRLVDWNEKFKRGK